MGPMTPRPILPLRSGMRTPIAWRRIETISVNGETRIEDQYISGYLDKNGKFRLTKYSMCRRTAPMSENTGQTPDLTLNQEADSAA